MRGSAAMADESRSLADGAPRKSPLFAALHFPETVTFAPDPSVQHVPSNVTTMTDPSPPSPPGRRTRFLWVVWSLVLLAVVGLGLVPELERNFLAWLRAVLVLVGLALTVVWFLVLGRFGWRTRLLGAAVLAAASFAAPRVFRVDGTVDGTGLPHLVLRGPDRSDAPAAVAVAAVPRPPAGTPAPVADPRAGDSTQFLGSRRDGVIAGVALSPDWKTTPPRQRWRIPVGAAWSAFAVSGNLAVTQEQSGGSELVVARDLATAGTLWVHTNAARFFQWQGGEGPRATPTLEGGRVYAQGGTGLLDCLSLADGRPHWSRNVLVETGSPNLLWGASSSPLVLGDSVVVAGGGGHGPTLLAYRKSDGKPLWQSGTISASYASPVAARLLDKDVILSVNGGSFTVHDPADGKVLLGVPWGDGKWPVAAQPVVVGTRRIFLSAGYGVGCVMLELAAAPDGTFSATEVWRNKMMKTQFNSAALRDGFLYGLDDGLLACVDAATGKRRWKDGRYGSGQSLVVGEHVLVQTEPGPVVLAAARPDGFAELGRLAALDSKTWNYPTVAGHLLLVRNDHEAACFELP